MSRLPKPGSDDHIWGDILNDYLLSEHNQDGTHNLNALLDVPLDNGKLLVSDDSVSRKVAWKYLDKQDVGLGNVDNTSDANKPVSGAVQTALDTKLNRGGDTIDGSLVINGQAGTKSVTLKSSYVGGDDTATGEDSTTRLNLESFQRANFHGYGETIRHYLMRKDSKAMEAWYGPDQLYDNDRNAVGTKFSPWTWVGSHYEANDHNSLHMHWEVEIPDSTGALQGRLEIPFGDPNTGQIGLDKTVIKTNLADLNVRCSNGQMLRLSVPSNNNMDIQFSHDSNGSLASRRWALRANATPEAGTNTGTDFQILNYDDSGNFITQALHIERKTGNVALGSSSPATKLDINGSSLRIRSPKTPTSSTAQGYAGEICWDTDYLYVCVATNTWKRLTLTSW